MNNNSYSEFFSFLNHLKEFFNGRGFVEVMTPPMVANPGIEPHIHPFTVNSARDNSKTGHYLHTSPEFWMKKLLAEASDLPKIYTLSFSFRDEPPSAIHRTQFLMLEWYRAHCSYEKIMQDCSELITSLAPQKLWANPKIITVNELFQELLNIEILDYLAVENIKQLISSKYPDIFLPEKELNWDDYFFLLFLNKIEPALSKFPFLIIKEYPYHLSALSKRSSTDPRVCERFEIYLDGIEVANCFHELCDLEIQKQRFQENNSLKKTTYGYQLANPIMLYESLHKGLPAPSGIALGVERLYSILYKKNFFLSNF